MSNFANFEANNDQNAVHELIFSARDGDEMAFSKLHSMYEGLIVSMVNHFTERIPNEVYTRDDLMQECLIAFYRAVERYDVKYEHATFGLYAKTCMQNSLISLLRKAMTVKRRMKRAQEKDEQVGKTDILDAIIAYTGSGETAGINFELFRNAVGDNYEADRLTYRVCRCLSKREIEILECFIKKMSYREISKELGIPEKAVDNGLYRVRRKLKEEFEKEFKK